MNDIEITIETPSIRQKVQEMVDKGDITVSLVSPTTSSPFPLWLYKGNLKYWFHDRWVNVGICKSDDLHNDIRITSDNKLRIKQ